MASIKFLPVDTGMGFDMQAAPRWQMIPERGFREVGVLVSPTSTQITVTSVTPAVVKIGKSSQVTRRQGYTPVRLEPVATGTGFVEASDAAGKLVARLQVSVKTARIVTVKYFFVEDSHMEKGKSTARPRTNPDAKKITAAINAIYEPQTNISFTSDNKLQRVKVDLGADGDVDFRSDDMVNKTYMTKSKDNAEWHAIAKSADPSEKVVNIFFCPPLDDISAREAAARDKEQGGTGEVRGLWGLAGAAVKPTKATGLRSNKNVCVLSDEIFTKGTPEFVVAHEIGHYLGEAHVEDVDTDTSNHPFYEANFLMWGGGGPGGTFINRDEANAMNPSGT